MKKNIHPNWYNDCQVTCACGNTFTTGSAQKSIQVEICSACHPFFTGEMKFVDTQGRVDKFLQKQQKAQAAKTAKSNKKTKQTNNQTQNQKSYKQLLQEQKKTIKKNAIQSPQQEDK